MTDTGKFLYLEEDNDESTGMVLLGGVEVEADIGEFKLLEEDRDEYSVDVLYGFEPEEPEPPIEKPRVGRPKKKYFDKIVRQAIEGLNILEQYTKEVESEVLSLAKWYSESHSATLGHVAIKKTMTYPMQLLELAKGYLALAIQEGLDISKLYKDEIITDTLGVLISKSVKRPIIGITLLASFSDETNILGMALLSRFSAELSVNTPDVDKLKLKRMIELIERIERLDKVTKT